MTTEITEAEQAATDARQRELELEKRIEDGDDTITADDLEQASSMSRFARLRANAARRRADKAAAKKTAEAQDAVREEWARLNKNGATGNRLAQQAADVLAADITAAVEKFAATVDADNEAVRAIIRHAIEAGAPVYLPTDVPANPPALYVANHGGRRRLIIDGTVTASDDTGEWRIARLFAETITPAAKAVHILGRPLAAR
ncbi:hypothetical protein [Zhihengliuella halotolerans]|uniref:hypothetical protein n=1 Tax=Zhihengliuella halotolerans TaxID=370736 RepID=UPI000C7F9BEF|nr:hypothetical protein [Zhihengliuella halotolerans]